MKNGYSLTRKWFNFSFEKKEAGVYHTALFVWIIELNNRLGWKQEFGLPTSETMEGLSIGNKSTYHSTLKDLERWGFIKIIRLAKNQFQSCIISVSRSESEPTQRSALDTALIQQDSQHSNGIDTGIVPIVKQGNKETNKPRNKSVFTPPSVNDVVLYFIENGYTEQSAIKAHNFYNVADWHDSKGKKVKNWKQKMQGVWFKDENKSQIPVTGDYTPKMVR